MMLKENRCSKSSWTIIQGYKTRKQQEEKLRGKLSY